MTALAIKKYIHPEIQKYYLQSRSHFFGLLLILLILICYEASSVALPVRNSAELMVKRVLWFLGLRQNWMLWPVYAAVLAFAYWFARKKELLNFKISYFPSAIFESLVYAIFFGSVVNLLSHRLTIKFLLLNGDTSSDLTAKMTLALGAGIYEELVFRLLLIGGIISLFKKLFDIKPIVYEVFAVLITAILFSSYHYMGGKEVITVDSFLFRFYAGVILGTIFLLRGIGVASYTHTFYDLFFVLRVH